MQYHYDRLEVDCIIDIGSKLIPVEMIVSDFFTSITKWTELAQESVSDRYIIYAGARDDARKAGMALSLVQAVA